MNCATKGTGAVTGEYLTPEDVAASLRVSAHDARARMRQMRHLRIGSRTVRVRRHELEWWKREQIALLYTTGAPVAPVTWSHAIPAPGVWPSRSAPKAAGVYVVQSGDDGPFKVGMSQDVATRVASLQTASPYELRFLGLISDDVSHETVHHTALASEHLRGEWFADSFRTRLYLAPLLGLAKEIEP
jgi:hypothetical protein